ncbi:MAG: hypothetical protein ACOYNL_04375 [Rickettsiales bacterium]
MGNILTHGLEYYGRLMALDPAQASLMECEVALQLLYNDVTNSNPEDNRAGEIEITMNRATELPISVRLDRRKCHSSFAFIHFSGLLCGQLERRGFSVSTHPVDPHMDFCSLDQVALAINGLTQTYQLQGHNPMVKLIHGAVKSLDT